MTRQISAVRLTLVADCPIVAGVTLWNPPDGESQTDVGVKRMASWLGGRERTELGASAVEYALLVVAIALIMAFGAFYLGKAVKTNMRTTGNCVNAVTSTGVSCPS